MAAAVPAAFFSYSRQDSEFVLRLARELRARGAEVWLDQLDIRPGQRWDNAVEQALSSCPRMLLILSPDAVESTHVMDEVSYALEEGKLVIPFLYRDCKIPFRLRRVQYIDARTDYQSGREELLKMLGEPRAEPGGAVPAAGMPQKAEPEQIGAVIAEPNESEWRRRSLVAATAAVVLLAGAFGVWKFSRTPGGNSIGPSTLSQPRSTTPNPSNPPDQPAKTSTSSNTRDEPSSMEKRSAVGAEWLEQFLQAAQGPSPEAMRPYFYDIVAPYYGQPSADWTAIEEDKKYYFSRFPTIRYTILGEPQITSTDQGDVVNLEFAYDNIRKDGNKATGVSHLTMTVKSFEGAWKIVAIQERSARP